MDLYLRREWHNQWLFCYNPKLAKERGLVARTWIGLGVSNFVWQTLFAILREDAA